MRPNFENIVDFAGWLVIDLENIIEIDRRQLCLIDFFAMSCQLSFSLTVVSFCYKCYRLFHRNFNKI